MDKLAGGFFDALMDQHNLVAAFLFLAVLYLAWRLQNSEISRERADTADRAYAERHTEAIIKNAEATAAMAVSMARLEATVNTGILILGQRQK